MQPAYPIPTKEVLTFTREVLDKTVKVVLSIDYHNRKLSVSPDEIWLDSDVRRTMGVMDGYRWWMVDLGTDDVMYMDAIAELIQQALSHGTMKLGDDASVRQCQASCDAQAEAQPSQA
jgi:hypothetical protein